MPRNIYRTLTIVRIGISQRTLICEVATLINNSVTNNTPNSKKAGEDQSREAIDPETDHTYYYDLNTSIEIATTN